MIHPKGAGLVLSFFCVLGHGYRVHGTDQSGQPITDRRAVARSLGTRLRALGLPWAKGGSLL
jgi:hypothetical protein